VDPARPCAWQLIYLRLKEIGQLDLLKKTKPPKNWRSSQAGGCRTIIREDHACKRRSRAKFFVYPVGRRCCAAQELSLKRSIP